MAHRWDWNRQEGVHGFPAQVYACIKGCGWEKTVGRYGTSFAHSSGEKRAALQWAIEVPKCADPRDPS